MNFYLVRRRKDILKKTSNWITGSMCRDCSGSIITEVESNYIYFPLAQEDWWINKPFTDQMEKEDI